MDDVPAGAPDAEPPTIESTPNEAELCDLARIAIDQEISLTDAIARYGWQDKFALVVDQIDEMALGQSGTATTSDHSARIVMVGGVPEDAWPAIDAFRDAFPQIDLEVRAGADRT